MLGVAVGRVWRLWRIRREDYGDLELDAKVELIRSLVPLGLMHVEEMLDDEVTALAGARYARKDASTSRQQSGDGGPRGAGVSPARGARIRCGPTPRCMARARSADAGAIWDFVPQLRGRGGGDSRGDRAVRPCPGRSSRPVPRNCTSSTSETSPMRTWWPSSWTFAEATMVIALGITVRERNASWASSKPTRTVDGSCGRCLRGPRSRKAVW